MNTLLLGAGDMSAEIRTRRKRPYLLITGKKIPGVRGQRFDWDEHSVDILSGMNYRRACDFVALIDEAFPEGSNTLTRKNSTFEILSALRENPTSFDTLVPEGEDAALKDARQKIERLMMSPVIKSVLTGSKRLHMDGNIVALLDRKVLGNFDAFFIAHLLISRYEHQVIVTEFDFYGRDHLEYLATEKRLICCVPSLDHLSKKLRNTVLSFPDKVGIRCTADDAEVLASYAGHIRGTNAYNDFVQARVA